MIRLVDSLFVWLRSWAFFYRLTIFTRILLAAGFIPTGLVKLMGERFTLISPEDPIGAFFEAMYQTGLYWRFLGATQMVAGVMLLLPLTAHLGAAVFLGIITNIFVITVSLDFRGTPVVTGLMLLAVVYLCFWDYYRFRPMLTTSASMPRFADHRLDRLELVGFVVFGAALLSFFGFVRGFLGGRLSIPCVVVGFAAGLFTLGRFVQVQFRARRVAASVPA